MSNMVNIKYAILYGLLWYIKLRLNGSNHNPININNMDSYGMTKGSQQTENVDTTSWELNGLKEKSV